MSNMIRDTLGYVDVEWKIDNFSKTKDDLTSPHFLLSDGTFCLYMLPNGDTPDENGWVSLYLIKLDLITEEHRVSVCMGLKKKDGSVFNSEKCDYVFTNDDCFQGWPKFIEYSKLLEMKDVLLPKDTLKIFCVARLMERNTVETTSQTMPDKGFETLMENFKDLYQKKNFCDVVIRFKDREFQVHESILSARSPVFAAMFKHDMVEKKSGTVDIVDCDSNSFEDFLLYLYTGTTEKVSLDNVFNLYRTADKYDVKELREKCTQYLACDLSVDSFCDAFLKAVMHNESELLESVTEFFIKNIKSILLTTKWLSFLENHHIFANELVMKALCKN